MRRACVHGLGAHVSQSLRNLHALCESKVAKR